MKNLLSIRDLSKDKAIELLSSSNEMSAVNRRAIKTLPTLRGKTVVNLFYENSTRTRISFEIAAKRLGADVINVSSEVSSASKGEGLKDTAQTLEALGADAIVLRHPMSGAAHAMATRGWISSSVINAGDGRHEHPTQALLDALTINRHFDAGCDFTGLKVLIVGDLLHSRVARSNFLLLNLLGATVIATGPKELMPTGFSEMGVTLYEGLDQALEQKPDAIMMLRVQKERMQADVAFSASNYQRSWSLTEERLGQLKPASVIMHPGPMNRGLEISNGAAEDSRSQVLEQVQNGLAVRMAVLHHLLGGQS
ncbi:MAG: aspartate carbamoyltransferase catalytic subunit [Aquiluna sp.]|nr:aspartate carbamoyltransferase catalytic subunit [Aquiluna sp.]